MTEELNDDTLMAFGKHAGSKLADVPASYLLWLAEQIKLQSGNDFRARLCRYVDRNRRVLEQECEEQEYRRDD